MSKFEWILRELDLLAMVVSFRLPSGLIKSRLNKPWVRKGSGKVEAFDS